MSTVDYILDLDTQETRLNIILTGLSNGYGKLDTLTNGKIAFVADNPEFSFVLLDSDFNYLVDNGLIARLT